MEYILVRRKVTRVGRRDLTRKYILTIAVLKESEEDRWNNSGKKNSASPFIGTDEAGPASEVDGWYPGPRIV